MAAWATESRTMPLSEDEQRILSEIEQQLYESDPTLAREVSTARPQDVTYRNVRIAAVGFVIGLAGLLFALPVHPVLAFAGFALMLLSTWSAERNLRRLGGISGARPSGGRGGYFGEAKQRLRDRLNEADEETS